MCKVSIIIPAYNIENYIERCLKSCINQTFDDIEIIVINDGSTDKTLEKINNFAENDSRIIVINKENEGPIEARKLGFQKSKGEYILFVDGDDYIHLDCINRLYNKAKEKEYDIVSYKWISIGLDGTERKSFKDTKIGEESFLELLFEHKIGVSLWSKLIKKDFILINNIEFPQNTYYGEDLAFDYALAVNNPKFIILDEYLYYYCRRESSLDMGVNEKTVDILQSVIFIKEQLKTHDLYDKYKEKFNYMAFRQMYYDRKHYIFNNNDKISKQLFYNWKKLNIVINSKNNSLYRDLYKNDSKKALIVEGMCKKSYLFGKLYYSKRS